MRKIQLANTPVKASELGFGCAALARHEDRQDARALLETALDAGITHFDVARLYGMGQAEAILGEFLRGKRDRVTVTTKFGLEPPAALAKHPGLVRLARRVSQRVGIVRRVARRAFGPPRARAIGEPSPFTAEKAAASLETSLRELGTDYVDVLELHEPMPWEARQEELLEFLERQVKAGRVRACGIGSGFLRFGGDAAELPSQLPVIQFDSDVFSRNVERMANAEGRAVVTYGAVTRSRELAAAIAAAPREAVEHWRERVGMDVTNPAVVAGLMLRYERMVNPNGVTLFGTTSRRHVLANVKAVREWSVGEEQVMGFGDLAREMTRERDAETVLL